MCGNIIDAKTKVSYFINLDGQKERANISNFISSPENVSNETKFCYKCNNNSYVKKEYSFFNTPKYLLIDFEGPKNPKKFEDEIDLTIYSMTNVGPKRYNLYAVIAKSNQKYIAYIKYKKVWYKFYDDSNVQLVIDEEAEITNCSSPYMAIYQGT